MVISRYSLLLSRYEHLKGPRGEIMNPFDRGMKENLKEFFWSVLSRRLLSRFPELPSQIVDVLFSFLLLSQLPSRASEVDYERAVELTSQYKAQRMV